MFQSSEEGNTPRDAQSDQPISREPTPSSVRTSSADHEPPASIFQPQQQQQPNFLHHHQQSSAINSYHQYYDSHRPDSPQATSPPDQFISSIMRDAPSKLDPQPLSYSSFASSLPSVDASTFRSSTAFTFNRASRRVPIYDDLNLPYMPLEYIQPQHVNSTENRQPFDMDVNTPGNQQSHIINPIRANSVSMNLYNTGSALPEPQQPPSAMHHQPFQASGQPHSFLNNLPNNLPSRDYIAALQQLQQAHNLAQQNGGPLPNILPTTQPVVSTIPGGHNAMNNGSATTTAPLAQEEISTIFVVGFPDDMQEREFQNMFTFCQGFEAATLKIPNKEHASFGVNGNANSAVNGQGPTSRPNAFPPSGYAGTTADPYNHLTVNSGGVVIDSRELSSAAASGLWNGINGVDGAPGLDVQHSAPPPPRKQIIGFAKFRTRAEALEAREVLQGRRVDAEKGAMLKAEMAKKNLHTKRGVGPLSNGLNSDSLGGLTQLNPIGVIGNLATHPLSNGHGQAGGPGTAIGETLTQHQRDMAAIGAMGLNGINRDRERDRERERERDREIHKDEQRETRTRMGSVHLNAYDAFHSIPVSLASQSSTLPARPMAHPSLPGNNPGSLTPGATPTSKQNGLSSQNEPIAPRLSSFSFASHNGLGGGSHVASFGLPSLHHSNVWSTSYGHTMVDPLDTTANANDHHGPSSASSNSLSLPSSHHTLSRRPSSSFHSSPPESNAAFPHSSSASSINESQSYDSLSPSPLAPAHVSVAINAHSQGPSVTLSPPLLHSQRSMHSLYGSMDDNTGNQTPSYTTPSGSGVSSSSVGSESPPEDHQKTILGSLHSSAFANGNGEYTIPSGLGTSNSVISNSSSSSAAHSNSDAELSAAVANLAVSTHQGMTSPQIPSPGSGGSGGTSTGRPNAADQNPPINTLYVGNLPSTNTTHPTSLEDALRNVFSRCNGYRKLCFRQKANGPMCFVEFEDVSCATKALNDLYGNTLGGLVKGGIRLSYSKNPLGVRTPSVSAASSNGFGNGNNLFSVALAGIPESRLPHHLLNPRHSLPTSHFAQTELSLSSLGRGRQESIDVISPASFSGFQGPTGSSFSRSFSPPSNTTGGLLSTQSPRGIHQLQQQHSQLHHQALIDSLNPLSYSTETRDPPFHLHSHHIPFQSQQLQQPAVSVSLTPSPGPGVEA